MALAADTSTNTSPLPSPWAQVVRGEPESVSVSVEKPPNDVVEVTPVMGAVSWPALSESTKISPKSSSDSSIFNSQGPVISNSPQKQANTNANPKSTANHPQPVRQRSMKRGAGTSTGSGLAQRGFNRPPSPPPLPPPFPVFGIPYRNMVPAVLDSSIREPLYKGNNWERNSPRRVNFGPHPRGDGPNFTSRDVHGPHQMGPPPPPRGFMRPPPPGSMPFITPQHVRPFGNLMGFDMASPYFYVPSPNMPGVPLVANGPPPPMLFPVMDTPLPTLIVNQIEYYFSDANLVKDNFLRSNMNEQGWVPITLIAGFPRVQNLTNNIQLILDSLRASTVMEVQDDKVRCHEWRKWKPSTSSGSESPRGSTDDLLATSLSKVALDEETTNPELVLRRALSSEELSG